MFVAYDNSRMQLARRLFSLVFLASGYALFSRAQEASQPTLGNAAPSPDSDHDRLPNGKSRSNAIAQSEHKKALEEADQSIQMAQHLREQIDKAGNYVVPLNALRTTEDIEILARNIRGRLKI